MTITPENSPALKRARSRQGFTLAELLVTMVMMIMASAVIMQALTFSYNVYFARTGETEAQLLCQTVSMLVQDDLTKNKYTADTADTSGKPSYTTTVDTTTGTATLTDASTLTVDGVTLPAACFGYGSGAAAERTVSISVGNLKDSGAPVDGRYKVTVSVKNRGGLTVSTNTFTVYYIGT